MRVSTLNISTHALATFLLLAASAFSINTSEAAPINPGFKLPGLAEAGSPSFKFNESSLNNSLKGAINNWYSDLFYIGRSKNGVTYDLVASNQGNFRYIANENQSYRGTFGKFQLTARLGPAGKLLKGKMTLTGRIKELGILNPNRSLAKADVTSIVSRNNVVGFSIDNISCAKEIVNCQDDPMISESIYMRLRQQFPDIRALGDGRYITSIKANITTVPVPAAVWLMLSGLGLLGAQAANRKHRKKTLADH